MNPEAHELAALTQALQHSLVRKRRQGLRRLGPGPQWVPERSPEGPQHPDPATVPTPEAVEAASPVSQSAAAAACTNMGQLRQAAGTCQACALHAGRDKPVFADGEPEAGAILFLGSAPSAEDNPTGIPYSGPAGQLLTDIIEKGMGLDRGRVSITHLVKCPTPGGRAPSDTEIGLCAPWLQRQLELASPSVLIPLGQVPANFLVGSKADLEELRDQVFERLGRRVVPTYEPAQLLLEPEKKRACWSDIQRAMAAAGLKKRP